MGRKRYIESDMSSDPELAEVAYQNPMAALMWPWLIKELDDWGRMAADSRVVKLKVFQAFPFKPQDIQEAMEALATQGLVHLYVVSGKQYLQVDPEVFYRIQTNIQHSRRRQDSSSLPPPPDHKWAGYWQESAWRPTSVDNLAPKHSNKQQTPAIVADNQQETALSVPSTLPPFHPTKDIDDDDKAASVRKLPDQDPDKAACIALINRAHPKWPLSGEPYRDFLNYEEQLPWAVMLRAVERTNAEGVRSLKYVKTILDRYVEAGVRTLVDAEAADAAYEAEKKGRDHRRGSAGSRAGPSQTTGQRDGSIYDQIPEDEVTRKLRELGRQEE